MKRLLVLLAALLIGGMPLLGEMREYHPHGLHVDFLHRLLPPPAFASGFNGAGAYLPAGVYYAKNNGVKCDGVTDDGPALRTLMAALPARGADVIFENGTCFVSTAASGAGFTIGSGGLSGWSTIQGVRLRGLALPPSSAYPGPRTEGGTTIRFSATGDGLRVQGPITGFAIENLSFMCNGIGSTNACVNVISGQYGRLQNFSIGGTGYGYGLQFTTVGNLSGANSVQVLVENFTIDGLGNTVAQNVLLRLTATHSIANTNYISFSNGYLQYGAQTGLGIYLGAVDDINFYNLQMFNVGACTTCTAVQFGYDNGISAAYPSACAFYNIADGSTGATTRPWANTGTPLVGTTAPNKIFGFSLADQGFPNGVVPNLENLVVYENIAQPASFTFANIATGLTGNGQIGYCSDCTIANPCAGGGTGAIAKRLNDVNVCN